MKAVNEMKIWLSHRKTAGMIFKSELLRAAAAHDEPLTGKLL